MKQAQVSKAEKSTVITEPWGSLTWFASKALGNSDSMTVGKCIIKPGNRNPRHSHPNCTEILTVVSGTVSHEIGQGKSVTLAKGDTITVPPDLPHSATNIGTEDAVLFIAFSSADRQTKGE